VMGTGSFRMGAASSVSGRGTDIMTSSGFTQGPATSRGRLVAWVNGADSVIGTGGEGYWKPVITS
jgi:hypothetical protein